MNKASSMAEEKECVSFLSFDLDGKLKWNVSIPHNFTDDFILEKVRLFLASVSMSSAVFKPYFNDPFVDYEANGTSVASRTTYVNCEDNTMIVAKQIEEGGNEWHGFIVRPSYVVSEEIILSMVEAFEKAAEHLVRKVADKHMKFMSLSESIRKLYDSDNWWRKKSLFIHLQDSLVDLGKSHCKEVYECSNGEKMGSQTRLTSTTALVKLKSVLLQWRPCAPSIWVASSVSEVVFYDNMTLEETEILSWYYISAFSIGNRERRHFYVEIAMDETVRLWFRHGDWVTSIQFTSDESSSLAVPRSVRCAADELMYELSKGQK